MFSTKDNHLELLLKIDANQSRQPRYLSLKKLTVNVNFQKISFKNLKEKLDSSGQSKGICKDRIYFTEPKSWKRKFHLLLAPSSFRI